MSNTTPTPESKWSPEQAQAFELGMLFGQFGCAQGELDEAAMRVALVNLINLRHNAAMSQAAGQTRAMRDLTWAFALGMMYAALLPELDMTLRQMSINVSNLLAETIAGMDFTAPFTSTSLMDGLAEKRAASWKERAERFRTQAMSTTPAYRRWMNRITKRYYGELAIQVDFSLPSMGDTATTSDTGADGRDGDTDGTSSKS